MRFMRSMDLSKNFLTALTDLVLTVRGSVSNEYPALGIPALQSGWSEWSKCGFTEVAETPEEYFEKLQDHIDGLIAGKVLITPTRSSGPGCGPGSTAPEATSRPVSCSSGRSARVTSCSTC